MSEIARPESATALTCFLSASRDAPVEPVRTVLSQLGIHVHTVDDLAVGTPLGNAISEAVLSADFVCVILTAPLSPAVMFEAGVAAGSRRPILTILTPDTEGVTPTNLIEAPSIRYVSGNEEALRQSLTAYVKQVHPLAAELKMNWVTLIDRARPSERSALGSAGLTSEVAQRLMSAGGFVATNVRSGQREADIAVTFPTLGDAFNLVVVEVKLKDSPTVRQDMDQLVRTMEVFNSRLGLLVYGGKSIGQRIEFTQGIRERAILVVDAERLLHEWDNRRIVQAITQLRNSLVHGPGV
ncbi:MAG TPA: hypothetical protein VMU51_30790 [Mycobacteriales bacterium]|nr:hypothetical protein [Mycobacteriales bacterium]